MTLKAVVRRLLPPVIYDLLRPGPAPPPPAAADPRVTLGTNVLMAGHIQIKGDSSRLIVSDDAMVCGILSLQRDGAEIRIGKNSLVNVGTVLGAVESIVIEDNVLISINCVILDSDGHSLRLSERISDARLNHQGRYMFEKALTRPITICSGAWLGAQCVVLKGVRVGVGAIVAAGSVVTRDVPDWSIVAGNPARVVRAIPEGER